MDGLDDSELWLNEGESESDREQASGTEDPTYFELGLQIEGQSGGFHVRNTPGQKQRKEVSTFSSGSRKRPAFRVSCTAKTIIHGTLDDVHNKPATLLIYDFSFFSYRSTRIKEANIHLEFKPKKGVQNNSWPTVRKVAPFAKHVMMQTSQTETHKLFADGSVGGGVALNVEGKLGFEKSIEKTTAHAAEITGDMPFDDWGNHFEAHWSLKENDSQNSGIVALFRTCILLERNDDEEFECIPQIEAKPSFKAWIGSLISSRTPDDPIVFDPSYEPYNTLEGLIGIDRWNLDSVALEELWDCTFQRTFANAIKVSKADEVVINKIEPKVAI
ncbi:hypothetical protein F5Y11DRAFT_349321 [Daldinia sp. FL1419]|nr:hypothetical protein F5Y11DRAFT_349321 [Daldinia sp. FL1419]